MSDEEYDKDELEKIAQKFMLSLEDTKFSASSTLPNHRIHDCRLNNVQWSTAWVSGSCTVGEWLQIDLGSDQRIRYLLLQPRGEEKYRAQCITQFDLKYAPDGSAPPSNTAEWGIQYNQSSMLGIDPSETDDVTFKVYRLTDQHPDGIYARYIRIYPLNWSSWMSLRVGLVPHSELVSNTDTQSEASATTNNDSKSSSSASSQDQAESTQYKEIGTNIGKEMTKVCSFCDETNDYVLLNCRICSVPL